MEEDVSRDTFDDDDLYKLDGPDELGVLSSTRKVVEQGEHVWIDRDAVRRLSDQWAREVGTDAGSYGFTWYDRYHFNDGTERTVNWVLLLDALNFCFWAEKGQSRWRIEYQGEVLDGYWAEAASLTRAVEEGMPLWDAEFMRKASEREVAHIFRGENTIPLFERRLEHMREVGRVLVERFDGQFARAIEETGGNAARLALLVAEHFPSFRDVVWYRQHEVCFLKRAQICVADIYGSFAGKNWGALSHIDRLTVFADYKLPQVLRHFGVLEYDPTLAERIDNQELLEPGSDEEVEIRAATIWACELLRREMATRNHVMTAAMIDQRLWLLGQNAVGMRPYHRVRTIYY